VTTKRNARPGVAAPERAVETETPCKMTTASTTNYTRSAADSQTFRIADLLSPGAESAISRRDLMSLTGFTDRELRLRIEAERRQGVPILSDNVHGYFLPGDSGERDLCVRSLRHRAKEIEATAAAIEGGENRWCM